MSTKICKAIHEHIFLNKDKILSSYESSRNKQDIYDVLYHYPMRGSKINNGYITEDNDYIRVAKLDTGEEWKIPKIMLYSLRTLDISDITESESNKDSFNNIDNLLIILNSLSKNLLSRHTDYNYMSVTLWNILGMIFEADLDTKWYRDEIYNQLGIIAGYITYSSPIEYNNY